MRVKICEACKYYKRNTFPSNNRTYGFCRLANKRCLEVKQFDCDDLRLTAEMNRILRKLLKRNGEDEYDNDKAGTADTPKPGQTDPS